MTAYEQISEHMEAMITHHGDGTVEITLPETSTCPEVNVWASSNEAAAELALRIRGELKTLARFEELLLSYARHHNMPRDSTSMELTRTTLLYLVRQGFEEHHDDETLVALAGISGNMIVFEGALMLSSLFMGEPKTKSQYDWFMKTHLKKEVNKSVSWLFRDVSPWRLLWRRYQTGKFLHQLFKKHIPRPA
jgi:hypothetical protein